MSKTILVIGGSVFCGRVFSKHISKNSDYELHVVNRGNFPLNLENVKEYKCDRHTPVMIAHLLPKITFDVVIDFCAYNPGEIGSLIEAMKGRFKQYIVISTASVYEVADHGMKFENDPIVMTSEGGSVSDYIYNKVLVEQETAQFCNRYNIPYTIFRPTFIYGPFNYAPRESWFIELIARGHVVPIPTESTARFNLVYVFDIAKMLEACIGNEKAYNQVYNLSAPEEITYNFLLESFENFNGRPFLSRPVTLDEIIDENIPFPYPLTEDLLYSGAKITEALGVAYTPFNEAMKKTFQIFDELFRS